MDGLLIVSVWCSAILMLTFIIILVLCACGGGKRPAEKPPVEGESSMGFKEDSQFATASEFDLNKERGGQGNRIPGIPKLPPKGEEVDAPLPSGYRSRDPGTTAPIKNIGGGGSGLPDPGATAPIKVAKKRGPRPKLVPKAGHTCPVQPADEDPTMPVEDDMMAYKMAAKNRPSAPIPPCPRA